MKTNFLVVAAVALTFCSCRSSEARPHDSAPTASTVRPTADAPAAAPSTGPLVFTAQSGWIAETPSSPTRKAQYRLPHVEKDTEDASLIVYHFGGQGGSKAANLERWAGQFDQPDGSASADLMQESSRKVNGMDVLEVDIAGTYVAETAPGSGERVHKDGWRMLAAIVDSAQGPYYVKLVGPAATIVRWEASFRAFVSAIKPGL